MLFVPTGSVLAVRPIIDYLASRGIAQETFLRAAGLLDVALEDDIARIPIHKLLFLWDHAEKLARDLDFGLHAGEAATFESFAALSTVAATSPTIGDGLRHVQRYTRYITGLDTYELAVEGHVAVLRLVRPRWVPAQRHASEYLFAIPHVYCRAASSRPWALAEVRFAHNRPSSTSEHARLFACPVLFGAPRDELRFSAGFLESPSVFRNDAVAKALADVTARLGEPSMNADGELALVRVFVWEALLRGDTSLGATAASMGLSERALQRRLASLGTSHRKVLDGVRALFAEHLVAQRQDKLAEIAVVLGFSEQTAFQRAYQRWTGTSPGRRRRQAR